MATDMPSRTGHEAGSVPLSVDAAGRRGGRRLLGCASVAAVLVMTIAACGGSPKAARSPAASTSARTTAAGVSQVGPSVSGSGTSTATSAPAGASNLTATAAVESQLLAAIAAARHLEPADYDGLVAGSTYYAIDHVTGDYWAGTSAEPSASSYQAQVDNQDDGSYVILTRTAAGTWREYDTGMARSDLVSCPVTVPADVLAVWGWAPGSCDPPLRERVQATTSAPPDAPLPLAHFADWTGRQPSVIYFSGDSGNIVSGLTWSWTASQAVGHGTWGYESCDPSCAQGTVTPYPAVVTLSGAVGGQFTKGVEQTSGPHAFVENFTLPSTAIGAS